MAVFERRYLKKIPPDLSVVKYVGFAPWKPWSLYLAQINTTYLATFSQADRYRLEKIGMSGQA
jgi:hypothetical protein